QQMVHPAWQTAAYENIEISCISMASVRATQAGFIANGSESVPAIQGHTLDGRSLTLFPGEVPKKIPDVDFWQRSGFDFTAFRPLSADWQEPLPHIRLDKALEFLLGDKLQ